jgi:L-iditol 2-dehydrogenase
MSLEDAAIIEPLSCAIHAVTRGEIQLDDVVVIAGAGPIGLMMVQVARLKTPRKLVVIDLVPQRLELARRYGADVVINPRDENALAIVRALTNGYGCDVYIEATGVRAAPCGLELVPQARPLRRVAVFGHDTTADWSIIGDRKGSTSAARISDPTAIRSRSTCWRAVTSGASSPRLSSSAGTRRSPSRLARLDQVLMKPAPST